MQRLILFAFSTIILSVVAAIVAGADENNADITVSFRSFLLNGSGTDFPLYFIDSEGDRQYVILSHTNISRESYAYRGPNPITFYEEIKPVASHTVPVGMREMILIFEENPHDQLDQLRYHITSVESDAVSFPLGSYLFFNQTEFDLAVQLDDELSHIAPYSRKLVCLGFDDSRALAARFFALKGETWERHYQLAWYFRPTTRQLVFLSRDTDVDRSLRIRTITDRHFQPLPPEEDDGS
jgi:hypothetical protein